MSIRFWSPVSIKSSLLCEPRSTVRMLSTSTFFTRSIGEGSVMLTPGPRVRLYRPNSVTTPRWEGEIECVLVKISHKRTSTRIAHSTSEPIGRPGRPPPSPPPPPKRARLRRSKSSIAETLPTPRAGLRPRRGGSPHGPPPCASSDGGSPPSLPLCPQGPLLSANRPRTRPPHPEMIVIAAEYRGMPHEKQWQADCRYLCRWHGASSRSSDGAAARPARPLAQGCGRGGDDHRRCHWARSRRGQNHRRRAPRRGFKRRRSQRSPHCDDRVAAAPDLDRDRQWQGRRR